MADAVLDTVRNIISDAVGSLISPPWLKNNGGVGQMPDTASDTWSTAETLMLACRMLNISPWFPGLASPSAVESMKHWILTSQQKDGSWPTYENPTEDVSGDVVATSLALLTLHKWHSDQLIRQAAGEAIAWLANARNADQGWSVADSRYGSNASTAFPTIFAYEAITVWKLDAVGNIKLVAEVTNGAKGWMRSVRQGSLLAESVVQPDPTPRHTSYQALTHRAVGGFDLDGKKIVKWLKLKQEPNGMWRHEGTDDIESTAIAIRALLALGVDPHEKVVTVAVGALLSRVTEGVTIGGHKYVGWPATPKGSPTSFLTFYTLMALLDFYTAMRQRRKPFQERIRGKGLRKWASAVLLSVAIGGFLFAVVLAADSFKVFAGALATLVAVAGIAVAIPAIANAWRRRK